MNSTADHLPSETPALADIEEWAAHYVHTDHLQVKLAPPKVPDRFRSPALPTRISAPGRPPEFRPARRGERTPKLLALREPHYRARAMHAFFHHELQAAELMCWAILAFADAEEDFRRGLLRVCLDEIRHMNMYREHIESLGSSLGSFGVRDWFWRRVPACATKLSFVAVMGMGFEAANLEYASDFAQRFRSVGDEQGALLQERVAREEIAHVAFATHWFEKWTGGCAFDSWVSHLPAPLSPWVLRGKPLALEARRKGGMSESFLQALDAYEPSERGPTEGRAAAAET